MKPSQWALASPGNLDCIQVHILRMDAIYAKDVKGPIGYANKTVQVQAWPRRARQKILMNVAKRYSSGWYADFDEGTQTNVIFTIEQIELEYRQDMTSPDWYDFVGVKDYSKSPVVLHMPGEEFSHYGNGHQRLAQELIRVMPGLNKRVAYPCTCDKIGGGMVQAVIIHLNDQHHPTLGTYKDDPWDRERIAQWTETLDIDLTVDTSKPAPLPVKRKPPKVVMSDAQKAALLKKIVNIKVDTTAMQKVFESMAVESKKAAEVVKGLTVELEFKNEHIDPALVEKLWGGQPPIKKEES